MRLWIGMHLPLLPLETLRPRWSEPGMHAVLERDRVLAATPEALAAGVRLGMRRGGVLAIAPGTNLLERTPCGEQEALQGMALALLQYTPHLALADDAGLLLEVGASLRLFGGPRAICRRARDTVAALGFTPHIAMAPTAHGAWLLARAGAHHGQGRAGLSLKSALKMASLCRTLNAVPFDLLPAAQAHAQLLAGIGCATLGDLRKLPRAGLQRRCGKQVLEELDQAYGDAAELFEWIEAPPAFSRRLELPDRIEHAEGLLFGARRLLAEMTGWLVARHLAITRFTFLIEHERGRAAVAPTPLEILLAEAAWREEHLLKLLKEKMARLVLAAPAIAMRLEATQLSPLAPPSDSLFPEPGGTPADYRRLLELLAARLGEDAVLAPAPVADYRPEVGNAWQSAARGVLRQRKPAESAPDAERPFWLMAAPVALLVREHRPFYGSPLTLLAGPERIECGWWDSALAVRDYYIAMDAEAACYWIYRERFDLEERWFLHGLFA
ncbi:DNA polymerase Y family protein [Janthinobacterium sp. 17J80-10]|uniref:Y-family DNA polymerase n=1 Tax=Janthinobacterium sp. 17J80-10 TaxID=2497863 RepID=UPI0010059843|nr:DNA polymerase Y family protein [Janthinobacterium sp. 17J80-10]QAU34483.1 DNA polymerase Y family protein [Janthinobacterium sp. 17J80-10]